MKDRGLGLAFRELQALFDDGAHGAISDGALLERFVTSRDETVFTAIVERHGPMVWGVCRRVLSDHHDAEDAFQATFLVLARRSATIIPREKLANWLYGVAHQTALKARACRTKRRARELQVPDMHEPQGVPDNQRDDLRERLDREVSQLPDKYRAPIVLCALEGRTHEEASTQLGWPIGTVSGRLARAKEILARRLSRHGRPLAVGSLSALLAAESEAAAMPAHLIASTAQAARLLALGRWATAVTVSAEVIALAREVTNAMLLSKLKIVATGVLAALTLAAGTSLAYRAPADAGPRPAPAAATPAATDPAPAAVRPPAALALANAEPPAPSLETYAYQVDPAAVREFRELNIDYGAFHLKSGPVSVVPMSTEKGITGAMIVGNGTFRYEPEKNKTIEGQFHALMLRFNPAELGAILPLDKGAKVRDRGVAVMSRQLLAVAVNRCWHRGQELMILPTGAFAAVVYSKTHGELLVSFDAKTSVAFSFSDRKPLYEKK